MLDFGEVCIYMLVKGVFGNVKIFLEHKNVKNLVMLFRRQSATDFRSRMWEMLGEETQRSTSVLK